MGESITAETGGLIRWLLASGIFAVFGVFGVFGERGMKAGDIDPRGENIDCHKVSDKVLAEGGGVLEVGCISYEPVVPGCSDGIIIIIGHHAAGHNSGLSFFVFAPYRNKLEAGLQDIHGGTVLDAQIIGFIAEEYYAKSLRSDFPSANVKA